MPNELATRLEPLVAEPVATARLSREEGPDVRYRTPVPDERAAAAALFIAG